jgi:hypothetical protein
VVATYEKYEPSPYMQGLSAAAKSIVNECGTLIQDALDTLRPRYDGSLLRDGGSGNVMRDAAKKVQWLWERGQVEDLESKLKDNTLRLSLLVSLTAQSASFSLLSVTGLC